MLQPIRKVHESRTSLLNKGVGSIPDRGPFRPEPVSGMDNQSAAGIGFGCKAA